MQSFNLIILMVWICIHSTKQKIQENSFDRLDLDSFPLFLWVAISFWARALSSSWSTLEKAHQ